MKKTPVVDGAIVFCDGGTALAELLVTCSPQKMITGKFAATEEDKTIKPPCFGKCKITDSGCQPDLGVWHDVTDNVQYKGKNALNIQSTINCGRGGTVRFITDGQKSRNQKASETEMNNALAHLKKEFSFQVTSQKRDITSSARAMSNLAKAHLNTQKAYEEFFCQILESDDLCHQLIADFYGVSEDISLLPNEREAFTKKYGNAPYAQKMFDHILNNPLESEAERIAFFENELLNAVKQGYKVSDHIAGTAVDVIPIEGEEGKKIIQAFKNEGFSFKDETNTVSNKHWHFSYKGEKKQKSSGKTVHKKK